MNWEEPLLVLLLVLPVVLSKGQPEAAVQSHQLKIDTLLNKKDTNIHVIKSHTQSASADDDIKNDALNYCQTHLDHLMLVIIGCIVISNCVILMTVMIYRIVCMSILTTMIGLVHGLLPLIKENSHDYVVTPQ